MSPPRPLPVEVAAEVELLEQAVDAALRDISDTSKLREAISKAERALSLRGRHQGEAWWQTVDARTNLADLRLFAGMPDAQRAALGEAWRLEREERALREGGQHAEARQLLQKTADVERSILGERHHYYAMSLARLALAEESLRRFDEADRLYEQVLAIRREAVGEEHPSYAIALMNRASLVHWSLKRPAAAEPLYREALVIRARVLGETHPDTLRVVSSLAYLYVGLSRFSEAERLYLQLVAARRITLGQHHPDLASAIYDLAFMYWLSDRAAEAEPLHREALEIRRRVLGDTHAEYVRSLDGLGAVYESLKRYGDAESAYREALEIRRRVVGENHLDYAASAYRLAYVYKAMKRVSDAEALYRAAMQIGQALGDGDLYLRGLNGLAALYWSTDRYGDAEALYQEALDIRRRTVGAGDPLYAGTLEDLGFVNRMQQRYERAETLYREALDIRERAQGHAHLATLRTMSSMARVYAAASRSTDAVRLFERVLELRAGTTGEEHGEYASDLHGLASAYISMERYDSAEPLARRALAIRERVGGKSHPDYVSSLTQLAQISGELRQFDEAERLYREALAIQQRTLGAAHVDTASTLSSLASVFLVMERYADAEPLYLQALQIARAAEGESSNAYGIQAANVGKLYFAMGRFSECEAFLRKAVDARKTTAAAVDASFAATVGALAGIWGALGRLGEAEPLYRLALEKVGSQHKQAHANLLAGLASLYASLGRYSDAEPLFREALASTRETSGDSHPTYGRVLSYLGGTYVKMARHEEAEALLQQALDLERRMGRASSPDFRETLWLLGELYKKTGRLADAEPLLVQARDLYAAAGQQRYPQAALVLTALADVYLLSGRHPDAAVTYRQSLDVLRETVGEQHPAFASGMHHLGHALVLTDRDDEAAAVLLESAVGQWTHLTRNFPSWSAEQKRQFQQASGFGQSDVLSALVFRGKAPATSGFRATLLTKQLTFEAARQESSAVRAVVASAAPEWQAAWQRREHLRARYANLALQSLSDLEQGEGSEQPSSTAAIRNLARQIEEEDRRLRQTNPSYAAQAMLQEVDLAKIGRALHRGDALIEYVLYRDYDFTKRQSTGVRYGAYVLRGDGVQALDLGDAAAIDKAVLELRSAVRGAIDEFRIVTPGAGRLRRSEAAIAKASADVRGRIWDPLAAVLEGATRVYVAPDGALGLMSFEALASDAEGSWRYLVEEREVVYLNTARDLGRLAHESGPVERRAAVLIGNPAFDASAVQLAGIVAGVASPESVAPSAAGPPASSTLGTVTGGEARRDLPRNWTQVPVLDDLLVRARAQLEALGWTVTHLTGARAVEEAALRVEAPRLLQFATHGYILDKPAGDAAGWDNPLLRSMLFLAGANTWRSDTAVRYRVGGKLLLEAEARKAGLSGDTLDAARVELADGVLTAYEVTGMNLHGTELVNLTACETGLGEVTPDGVAGLRQAFLLAGARALTMSMWEVPAAETTAQMRDFYDRWLGGGEKQSAMTRYGAFRSAQLVALARARETYGGGHPFYWAGTVYVGDPGDLPVLDRQNPAPNPDGHMDREVCSDCRSAAGAARAQGT